MVSHAYVSYLKKVKQDSSSNSFSIQNNKNRAGLKMARYLVRTSIKRLLPKKTLDKTTEKHSDGKFDGKNKYLTKLEVWKNKDIKYKMYPQY